MTDPTARDMAIAAAAHRTGFDAEFIETLLETVEEFPDITSADLLANVGGATTENDMGRAIPAMLYTGLLAYGRKPRGDWESPRFVAGPAA